MSPRGVSAGQGGGHRQPPASGRRGVARALPEERWVLPPPQPSQGGHGHPRARGHPKRARRQPSAHRHRATPPARGSPHPQSSCSPRGTCHPSPLPHPRGGTLTPPGATEATGCPQDGVGGLCTAGSPVSDHESFTPAPSSPCPSVSHPVSINATLLGHEVLGWGAPTEPPPQGAPWAFCTARGWHSTPEPPQSPWGPGLRVPSPAEGGHPGDTPGTTGDTVAVVPRPTAGPAAPPPQPLFSRFWTIWSKVIILLLQ